MQSSLVAATVLFAVSLGVSMKQIHAATGLSTADLLDTNARLPDHLVALVWKLIDAARPGEALPLKMAAIAPELSGFMADKRRVKNGNLISCPPLRRAQGPRVSSSSAAAFPARKGPGSATKPFRVPA